MTTHTAICEYYAGATLDADSLLCHRTTDATVYTASATSEINTGGGVYSAVFADVAAGIYRLKLKADGDVVFTQDFTFSGVDGEVLQAGIVAASTGARTVTITVTDGTDPLENATVRLTNGALSVTATTDVSGEATLNVDDATYTVAVTKAGYSYAGTSLVVDGNETATYAVTQVVVSSPADPSLSAIEVLCLGTAFTAQSGIDIDFRMSAIPSSDQNNAFPGAKVTVTSNGSGIARWEAPQGATIEYKRGSTLAWTSITLDSDSVTNVTSVIGTP